MLIPCFALKESERNLLHSKLNRTLSIQMNSPQKINAYIVEDAIFEQICNFLDEMNQSLQEADSPIKQDINRSNVLRLVTTVFNVMVDVQKIKDPDMRTTANAGLLASVIGINNISPEYGNRLISILKSKI